MAPHPPEGYPAITLISEAPSRESIRMPELHCVCIVVLTVLLLAKITQPPLGPVREGTNKGHVWREAWSLESPA